VSGPVERIQEGRVVRIRMNRAERRNVLSRELCRSLLDMLMAADRDDAAGVILLESAGPVFCGGWDPEEAATTGDLLVQDELLNIGDVLTKPLVAAVQGPALGPGVALLANADVAVAAQGATFAMTDVRNGCFPFIAFGPLAGTGASQQHPRSSLTIGRSRLRSSWPAPERPSRRGSNLLAGSVRMIPQPVVWQSNTRCKRWVHSIFLLSLVSSGMVDKPICETSLAVQHGRLVIKGGIHRSQWSSPW
jgi:hypothetical protein